MHPQKLRNEEYLIHYVSVIESKKGMFAYSIESMQHMTKGHVTLVNKHKQHSHNDTDI